MGSNIVWTPKLFKMSYTELWVLIAQQDSHGENELLMVQWQHYVIEWRFWSPEWTEVSYG